MQIVIDIPEEEYQTYINHTEAILDSSIPLVHQDLLMAVINGTPLPKGHGRLIDADALNISYGVFVPKVKGNVVFGCPADAVFADELENAPTIIDADGGDAE